MCDSPISSEPLLSCGVNRFAVGDDSDVLSSTLNSPESGLLRWIPILVLPGSYGEGGVICDGTATSMSDAAVDMLRELVDLSRGRGMTEKNDEEPDPARW